MTYLKFIPAALVVIILAFYAGRYTSPKDTAPDAVTATAESTTKSQQHTTTVTTKTPEGAVQTTTTTDITTNAVVDKQSVKTPAAKLWNVSALTQYDMRKDRGLIYGLAVSKQVVGPITVGLFGYESGIIGLSLGVNF